ncbi:MAG: cysteine peptidase family C39 domain-containing protein [Bacteroidota bacterium]
MRKFYNAVWITAQLLKSMSVKFSLTGLEEKLEAHPDYPSMVAISDCLTEWQVANEALRVPKEHFKDLPLPFIAHCNVNGGTFILVHGREGIQIRYSDEKKQNSLMQEKDFVQRWSGVVLLAEADEDSGEPGYKQNIWKDRLTLAKTPLLIILLITLLGLTLDYNSLTLGYSLLLLINLVGLGISTLLLINSVDANNPLVQNLCSLGGKNGCNAILKSDAAKLTSWLSWSEVGFFYFSGSFLALFLIPSSISFLAWINFLALPYTLYSIGYQYRNSNWCVLCCAVQALLWFGFITAFSTDLLSWNRINLPSLYLLPLLVLCFLLPIVTWAVFKSFFTTSIQFKPIKQQLKKFKYNGELFNQVLVNQPRYAVGDDLMAAVLGNPEAKAVITMVSNPFCDPCASAHKTIDEWLRYRDDLKLNIIFTTADHQDDEKTKVSKHISALTRLNDPKLLENALNDWYAQGKKKYETWAKKYPVSFNGDMDVVTARQREWCDMAEIAFTPTILVNGYKLPHPYQLEDIKYLIT